MCNNEARLFMDKLDGVEMLWRTAIIELVHAIEVGRNSKHLREARVPSL